LKKFGRNVLDKEYWPSEQWNYFYNTKALSVVAYFQHGKVEANKEALDKRRLRQEMTETFFQWADEYFSEPSNFDKEIERRWLEDDFTNKLRSNERNFYTNRKIKSCLKAYCKYKSFKFNPGAVDQQTGENFGGDIKRNGKELFIISTGSPKEMAGI
jgi:hypothetical protein